MRSAFWFLSGAQGTTLLSAPVIGTATPGWNVVGATDFNGDGIPDIVLQDPSNGQVSVWYMSGAQGSTISSTLTIATAAPNWLIRSVW